MGGSKSPQLTAKKASLLKHLGVDPSAIRAAKERAAHYQQRADKQRHQGGVMNNVYATGNEILAGGERSEATNKQHKADAINAGAILIKQAEFKLSWLPASPYDSQGPVEGGLVDLTFQSHGNSVPDEITKKDVLVKGGRAMVENLLVGKNVSVRAFYKPPKGTVCPDNHYPFGEHEFRLKGGETFLRVDFAIQVQTKEFQAKLMLKVDDSNSVETGTTRTGSVKGGGEAKYGIKGTLDVAGEATLPIKIPVGIKARAAIEQNMELKAYVEALYQRVETLNEKVQRNQGSSLEESFVVRKPQVGGMMKVAKYSAE